MVCYKFLLVIILIYSLRGIYILWIIFINIYFFTVVGWKIGKEELNWKKDKIWREKKMRNKKVFWVIFFILLNIFRFRLVKNFYEIF